jgi:hypothetical protein
MSPTRLLRVRGFSSFVRSAGAQPLSVVELAQISTCNAWSQYGCREARARLRSQAADRRQHLAGLRCQQRRPRDQDASSVDCGLHDRQPRWGIVRFCDGFAPRRGRCGLAGPQTTPTLTRYVSTSASTSRVQEQPKKVSALGFGRASKQFGASSGNCRPAVALPKSFSSACLLLREWPSSAAGPAGRHDLEMTFGSSCICAIQVQAHSIDRSARSIDIR